jgi:hypothetical protein
MDCEECGQTAGPLRASVASTFPLGGAGRIGQDCGMKLLLCLLVCFSFSGAVYSSDGSLNEIRLKRFLLDWTITCNMALGVDPSKEVFSELCELDKGAAGFVAHFWRVKADAAVLDAKNDLTERFAHQSVKSPKDKERLESEMFRDHQMLIIGYYYDHAPEIKAMIETRLRLAKEGKSSTLLRARGGQ